MSKTITIIKGDGIGPEIMDATLKVLDATGAGFNYEFVDAGLSALEKTGELLPEETLDTIAKNGICLKGPLTTWQGIQLHQRGAAQAFRSLRQLASCCYFSGHKVPLRQCRCDHRARKHRRRLHG